MQGTSKEGQCRYGGRVFEDVDVTPAGAEKERYFTRCKKYGLVIDAYRCGSVNKAVAGWARFAGKLVSGI